MTEGKMMCNACHLRASLYSYQDMNPTDHKDALSCNRS